MNVGSSRYLLLISPIFQLTIGTQVLHKINRLFVLLHGLTHSLAFAAAHRRIKTVEK